MRIFFNYERKVTLVHLHLFSFFNEYGIKNAILLSVMSTIETLTIFEVINNPPIGLCKAYGSSYL